MKYFFYTIGAILFSSCNNLYAQFAPQALLVNSTAIYKDSISIIEWGSVCQINRGWLNIADTNLGKTSFGIVADALGKADGNVISLGDKGEAIFYFENPINDQAGFDFAIFENGFRNPLDSNEAFLELATVSVSNDGVTYYPFPSTSFIDTISQIAGAGEYMDARKIDNLAGKYIANYGTPFDIDILGIYPSLDKQTIRYVKILDVVGTIEKSFATFDKMQHKINDPYPTPYPTGGFDLDALAVLHQKYPTGFIEPELAKPKVFPNPFTDKVYFSDTDVVQVKVYAMNGKCLLTQNINRAQSVSFRDLKNGFYILKWIDSKDKVYHQYVQKW
jgi:hypothetical protein